MARSGQFRDLIAMERQVRGDDGHGNEILSWAPWEITVGVQVTLWADMLERLGGEKLAAGRLEAARIATVRLRSNDISRQITAADRFTARGITWKIISAPSRVGRKDAVIEMTCEEWVKPPA